MRFTLKNIIDSLPQKKNSNSSLWVKVVVRKLSFIFTYFFINMGFSANAVSCLSIVVAVTACTFYMINENWALVLAIVLINFWLVLDCVDGNIARCLKRKTVFGEFVDDIGGYYVEALVYLAIGVCASHMGGILFAVGSEWIIIIGAISSSINVLSRLIYKDYGHFAIHADKSMQEEHTIDDKHSLYYIRNRVSKEFGMSGLFMPLTIICALTHSYDLMTLFYFAFNGFALLSTTVIYFFRANKYDKEKN